MAVEKAGYLGGQYVDWSALTGLPQLDMVTSGGLRGLSVSVDVGGAGFVSNLVAGHNLNYQVTTGGSHAFYVNGVNKLSVSSSGATAYGSLAVSSPTSNYGSLALYPGSAGAPGYVAFLDGAGTRRGYAGYQITTGYLALETENGYLGWEVTGQLLVRGGVSVTSGGLSVSGVGCTPQMAAIAVTAANTLAALPTTCSGICILFVNGQAAASGAASPAFTVSGTTLTWNAGNAGYSLATTDSVVAFWMR